MVARRYWHYTVFERFQSIVSDRMINTADTLVPREVKRVVWFSTNPCWEKTVVKIVLNNETGMKTKLRSRDELFNFGSSGVKKEAPNNKVNAFTPIRFEADPEKVHLRSFQNYKKKSGDSKLLSNNALAMDRKKSRPLWQQSPATRHEPGIWVVKIDRFTALLI
jgi:hypothetical protein